ncbi:MAG: CHASE2 domain-containing protein [Stigonema ocellatum SAG 48.90 = DSM 106950]|nr:CHASE2 domain-containing protein [Stigonema ocellatum SAG 48.90 = DSM 106950]
MITELLQKLRVPWVKDKRKNDKIAPSWLQTVAIASVGVTAIVLGVRELKGLQSWELNAYDQMLRLRPDEPPEPRILVVTITQEDIQRENWPLPDSTINRLLAKLESYQPRVIGLDIYRPKQKNLADGLPRDNIISICTFSSTGDEEIPPPPDFPTANVGFSDVVSDDDYVVRRSLLFARSAKDKKCNSQFSLAALLTKSYLNKVGIELHPINKHYFQLGKTLFPTLTEDSGGYEHVDSRGRQILINYHDPHHFVKQVTFTQVLTNQLDPNLVKDRLVIIGTTARSVNSGFYTPYSALPDQPPRMPPVFIHAHIASEIISNVLDGRPLIWYWSNWAEGVWVWAWSLAGGVLAWRLRHPLRLVLAGGGMLFVLAGVCYILFLQAGWVPMIPPALALVMTGVSVMVYTTYQTQQQTKLIIVQVEKQQEAIAQLNTLLKESTAIQDKHLDLAGKIATPEKATGDLLLSGRYKITKVLGSGGFGQTYVAEDTQRPGNPTCVVKQLMPARRDTKFLQVARRLFDAEAEILEVLGKHHQIPELLAYFEENNEFYLVQEYIEGHALSDELPPVTGMQQESWVIDMLRGVLEVLAFVHEHRVIHRDIKPSNIIRSATDNRLVLIDFGAVKFMQPPTSEQTELATIAIGTRGYAPPEQFVGHPRLSSDIYALGMIAIQAITGISPQELQPNADTGTVVWRPWAQVSVELAGILDKMVRYHFSDRYPSAAAVLQDLNQIGADIA